MFLDLSNHWRDPPGKPPPPPRRGPDLSPRQKKTLGWIVVFNLAMLLLGPLAGGSVIHAMIALAGR